MASRCKCVQYVHHGFTLSLPQSSIVAVLQAMVVVVSTSQVRTSSSIQFQCYCKLKTVMQYIFILYFHFAMS